MLRIFFQFILLVTPNQKKFTLHLFLLLWYNFHRPAFLSHVDIYIKSVWNVVKNYKVYPSNCMLLIQGPFSKAFFFFSFAVQFSWSLWVSQVLLIIYSVRLNPTSHIYTYIRITKPAGLKVFACRKSAERTADFSNYCLLKQLFCCSSNTPQQEESGGCWSVLSYPYPNLLSSFINSNIPICKCFNIFLAHIMVKSSFVLPIKLITLLAT